MYLGRIVELADRRCFVAHPTHPYTEALLQAAPVPDPHARRERPILEGEVPSPLNLRRMHVPSALSVCGGAVPGGAPGAARDRGRADGGVPFAITPDAPFHWEERVKTEATEETQRAQGRRANRDRGAAAGGPVS